MDLITVSGVSKKEAGKYVLQDVHFKQPTHCNTAIVGATGSGKTTLLKIIAGLLQPDEGAVYLNNERIKGPEEKLIPGHPSIAYLSQHFELRNNYRVEEELDYANKLDEEKAHAVFEVCRIDHLLKRWTNQLSGGERQRISIARLLIGSPKLLLLDEPFSNLDILHRRMIQSVISNIGEQFGITCIMVSHDPLDILSWAEEIIILQEGHIIQQGRPHEIYFRPVNEYAAGLFGSYNLLDHNLARALMHMPGISNYERLFVRPSGFSLAHHEHGPVNGKINRINFLGGYYEVEVMIGENLVIVKTDNNGYKQDDKVFVSLKEQEAWIMKN